MLFDVAQAGEVIQHLALRAARPDAAKVRGLPPSARTCSSVSGIAFDGGRGMDVARAGVLLQRRNPRQFDGRALDRARAAPPPARPDESRRGLIVNCGTYGIEDESTISQVMCQAGWGRVGACQSNGAPYQRFTAEGLVQQRLFQRLQRRKLLLVEDSRRWVSSRSAPSLDVISFCSPNGGDMEY